MTGLDLDQRKRAIRERIWELLEREGVAPAGASGHIPTFVGAEAAAERLAALPTWQDATVIKANPDRAQLPVRVTALHAGKLLYMAVPRLATPKPFYLLDPAALSVPYEEAATGDGAACVAPTVGVEEMRPVDLIVCGSVAVNRSGARLGKGAGYSDIELGLLAEAGLIREETVIATTVHQLQVVGEEVPEADHDFRADVVLTPEEVIQCESGRRPSGIDRERLTEEQLRAMPVLRDPAA